MADVYVEVVKTFGRSNNGDDVLVYEAGNTYPFRADLFPAYEKAGFVKLIEAKKSKPKAKSKAKKTKEEESPNGES